MARSKKGYQAKKKALTEAKNKFETYARDMLKNSWALREKLFKIMYLQQDSSGSKKINTDIKAIRENEQQFQILFGNWHKAFNELTQFSKNDKDKRLAGGKSKFALLLALGIVGTTSYSIFFDLKLASLGHSWIVQFLVFAMCITAGLLLAEYFLQFFLNRWSQIGRLFGILLAALTIASAIALMTQVGISVMPLLPAVVALSAFFALHRFKFLLSEANINPKKYLFVAQFLVLITGIVSLYFLFHLSNLAAFSLLLVLCVNMVVQAFVSFQGPNKHLSVAEENKLKKELGPSNRLHNKALYFQTIALSTIERYEQSNPAEVKKTQESQLFLSKDSSVVEKTYQLKTEQFKKMIGSKVSQQEHEGVEQESYSSKEGGAFVKTPHLPGTYFEADGCLKVAKKLSDKSNNSTIMLLVMAHPLTAGGGILIGSPAQEEHVCRHVDDGALNGRERRTQNEHKRVLYKQDERLLDGRCRIVEDRLVVRNPITHQWLEPQNRFKLDLLFAAAPENKDGGRKVSARNQGNLFGGQKLTQVLQQRIYSMLYAARERLEGTPGGHKLHLVLSAFGCGAFKNEPNQVAKIFYQALASKEFNILHTNGNTVTFAVRPNEASSHGKYGADAGNGPVFQRFFGQE